MIKDYENPQKYAYRVEKYPNYIIIKKEWYLWRAKWVYAILLNKLLWYSLKQQGKDRYVWTAHLQNLREKLEENNLSYLCINKAQCLYKSPKLNNENFKLIDDAENIDLENI